MILKEIAKNSKDGTAFYTGEIKNKKFDLMVEDGGYEFKISNCKLTDDEKDEIITKYYFGEYRMAY